MHKTRINRCSILIGLSVAFSLVPLANASEEKLPPTQAEPVSIERSGLSLGAGLGFPNGILADASWWINRRVSIDASIRGIPIYWTIGGRVGATVYAHLGETIGHTLLAHADIGLLTAFSPEYDPKHIAIVNFAVGYAYLWQHWEIKLTTGFDLMMTIKDEGFGGILCTDNDDGGNNYGLMPTGILSVSYHFD